MPYCCFVNPFDDSKCCSCRQQYNACLCSATIKNSVHCLSCVHNRYICVYSDASLACILVK